MRKSILFSGIAVPLAALSGWLLNSRTEASAAAYQPNLAQGEALYAVACAACHGANLEGEANWRVPGSDGMLLAPPHDASGHTWHHSDRVLLDITMRGTAAVVGGSYESNMPGFRDIYTQDELRDILEWIKTTWPERERAHQAQVTAQDEALR